ncbi:MAG: family 20 glycosylhydrolase [Planctomycetes bacterium]|nr:family 20 glycosylhydrolase [Planctomycetota bacterium]
MKHHEDRPATRGPAVRLGAMAAIAALFAAPLQAQVIAYDEFDGRCRNGWKEAGLGEWAACGGVERDGAFVTERGNDWRALDHLVDGVVWYAVTLRLAAPIDGYVTVAPSDTARGQFSELGFNSGYATQAPLWTTGRGIAKAEALGDGTRPVTFLQRYDFARQRWNGWVVAGDGATLLPSAEAIAAAPHEGDALPAAEPLVRDAAAAWRGIGWLYLSKGSAQAVAIERVAFARTAREALTPVTDPATPVESGAQASAAGAAAKAAAAFEAAQSGDGAASANAPIAASLRRELFGAASLLRDGDVVSFFGDSLTWQGGYVDRLAQECAAALPGRDVKWIKRGINGGKSTDLLAGCKELYGCTQAPLAECVAQDGSRVVVLLIGINDVWHGANGNPPAVYESTLRELVRQAQRAGAAVVVATPPLIGERVRGSNEFDAPLDEYAAIALRVAAATGAIGLPLRERAFAQLAARNRADAREGVLTYDGVHLSELGNEWLAEEMAGALADALRPGRVVPIVPWPREVVPVAEQQHGRAVGRIVARSEDAALRDVADALQEAIAWVGRPPDVEPDGVRRMRRDARAGERNDGGRDELRLVLDATLGAEEYVLDTATELSIRGGSPRAVAWGGATLLQLVSSAGPLFDYEGLTFGNATTLPRLAIRDAPDVGYRGLLVDVARQPHTLATLKQLVTLCWLCKVPWMQLHLTDDQAWTVPSRRFPNLATPGHSFTREEIGELVRFAAARGVAIVPEIDMPGHCGALIAAQPLLFKAHELHHATIAFAKPEVVEAMKALVDEAIELFPGAPWFHLGGDECDLEHVDQNPAFPAAYAREGVADKHGLYLAFLREMTDHVKKRGRRPIVWEGFGHGAQPELPRDVVVMAYEALYHLPDCLLRDGWPVINTSWEPLYVVNQRCWSPERIHRWNRFQWDHFVEGFPAFDGLTVLPTDAVLGGQLCSWEQPDALELPSLRARLPVMAERLWSERAERGWPDLAWRSAQLDALLDRLLADPRR